MEQNGDKLEITRLNDNIKSPSYLVRYKYVNILFDMPVDLSVLRNFFPQHPLLIEGASNLPTVQKSAVDGFTDVFNVNNQNYLATEFKFGLSREMRDNHIKLETIDAVIISNSISMLGLPLITANPKFKGKIFATEPTIQFGKRMILDILNAINSLPASVPKLDLKKPEYRILEGLLSFCNTDLADWYDIYSEKTLQQCLTKIRHVSYDEPFSLYGLLDVRGVCSGYSIGSCNWLISTPFEKITYISHTSCIVSHCAAMDLTSFNDVDVMIIGTAIPEAFAPIEKLCDDMCTKICDTIKAGGNVLIPISCCGLFFDLVEKIHLELVQRRLDTTQIFVLGSQARACLAYANIYGEWLNKQREAQRYTAEYPFNFQKLMKSNVLITCDDIAGDFSTKFRSPAVVFASHPSLRMGPVVHLLRLWGSSPSNALFLVDTENYCIPLKKEQQLAVVDRLLGPFAPVQMSVHYYPMETRIKVQDLPRFIDQVGLPRKYIVFPTECGLNKAITNGDGPNPPVEMMELQYEQRLVLSMEERESEHDCDKPAKVRELDVLISPGMSEKLRWYSVPGQDANISLFETRLSHRDGQYELLSPTEEPSSVDAAVEAVSGSGETVTAAAEQTGDVATAVKATASRGLLVGSSVLDVRKFLDELRARGLTDAKLETLEEGKRYLVCFTDENSIIQLYDNCTHVLCSNEDMSKKIQDALVACFTVLST